MEQTEYFKRRVLRERPFIRLDWCERAVREPEAMEVQADGRIRCWRFIPELGKHLRVITLPDGETLHNASPTAPSSPAARQNRKRHDVRVLPRH